MEYSGVIPQVESNTDSELAFVYNLSSRVTCSPGAAWYSSIRTFERVGECSGDDEGLERSRRLLQATLTQAKQLNNEIQTNPEYARSLHEHDLEHFRARGEEPPEYIALTKRLPVEQRVTLALLSLSGNDYKELAQLLQVKPTKIAMDVAKARLLLSDIATGSSLSDGALQSPEKARGIALVAVDTDKSLEGTPAAEVLNDWKAESPRHVELAEAITAAADIYSQWHVESLPEGLRLDCVQAIKSGVGESVPSDISMAEADLTTGDFVSEGSGQSRKPEFLTGESEFSDQIDDDPLQSDPDFADSEDRVTFSPSRDFEFGEYAESHSEPEQLIQVTPVWQIALVAALAALLVILVVFLTQS